MAEKVISGFTVAQIVEINRSVIQAVDGIGGLIAGVNFGFLEGALGRVDNKINYEGLEDIFEIAAWYAVAIAKAHAFSDGNKRTGFVVALTYLEQYGLEILALDDLEQIMVDVAEGQLDAVELGNIFYLLMKDTPEYEEIDVVD